jgi:hypothetical protein
LPLQVGLVAAAASAGATMSLVEELRWYCVSIVAAGPLIIPVIIPDLDSDHARLAPMAAACHRQHAK